jgi:hypothetical protein
MLLAIGVKVTACRLEVGRVALGVLVNVDGVRADGEVFEADLDDNVAALAGHESGFAGVLACAGLNGDGNGVFGLGEGGDGDEAESECSGGKGKAHGLLLLRHVQG